MEAVQRATQGDENVGNIYDKPAGNIYDKPSGNIYDDRPESEPPLIDPPGTTEQPPISDPAPQQPVTTERRAEPTYGKQGTV